MPTAIEVDRVCKKFLRGERVDSLRDLLPTIARGLLSRDGHAAARDDEFWALRDVSFSVGPGDALGIVGPNGAGKSTMLRLLTRILRPTSGSVKVRGRVGALIEIAAAFHPDLTGRENIFLQGAILGMRRAEVARKLDAIVDFAGVSEFIDTPVKRYSSGMHARLGFSVAAHLDPDVLLIDEVLSVGDMAFQQKCVERMKEFKRQGVAITFVSHNLQAVAGLCERALYLHNEMRACGPAHEVIERYVSATYERGASDTVGGAAVVRAELVDADGVSVRTAAPHALLKLRVTFSAAAAVEDVTFGFLVHRSTDNLLVYDANVPGNEIAVPSLGAREQITVDFCFRAHVSRGQYHLECHLLHNPTRRFLTRLRPAALLTIDEDRSYAGVVDLELEAVVVERTET
jgi:lipopolysaccharide transport system ATP-binding protein